MKTPGLNSSLYHFRCWKSPETDGDKYWMFRVSPPDYLNDLNAMHEAEKVLNWDQQKVFISHLLGLEGRNGDALWTLAWDSAWLCSHATAAQRAEAFLRVIGRWVD